MAGHLLIQYPSCATMIMRTATFFTQAVFLLVFATTVLAQAIQLSNVGDLDVRFPLTVAQCERIRIYYNITREVEGIFILAPGDAAGVLRIHVPPGIGYIEWICDIPSGHGFYVSFVQSYYLVVQPGSSSCLGQVTTTYDYLEYFTANFQSYTALSPTTTVLNPYASAATYV